MATHLPKWASVLLVLAGAVLGFYCAAGMLGPNSVLPFGKEQPGISFYLIIGAVAGAATSWATIRN
jgi:hypothetical protein